MRLAKFWIETVELAAAAGFSARELRQIERLVSDNQENWLEAWHEFFGRPNSSEGS